MRILLFGCSGQLGSALQRSLSPIATVIAPQRIVADLDNPNDLARVLTTHRPDVLVNAAAYTAVDNAEQEKQHVQRINHDAVHAMATYASNADALLVHYSTDYVFDGQKPQAYTEDDIPNPLNVYGMSKWQAEQAIAASGCEALIFRTSWIYSASGNNFLRTILRLARERQTLDVVNDQIGAPTSAQRIAGITATAIVAHNQGRLAPGTYHLSAAGRTSWHGLACHIVQAIHARGLDATLQADAIRPVASNDYPQAARRPQNSVLDSTKLGTALGLDMPDWRTDVDDTLDRLLSV